jgi:hypothetical protein
MKLIAFSGKAQAGKTTAALHAISIYGGIKVALGDAVKEEVAEFLDYLGLVYEHRHLYGTAQDRDELVDINSVPFKIIPPELFYLAQQQPVCTYRRLLQFWGTDYRRAQNPSYWCDRAMDKINAAEGLVFIDDVRFPDEVECIQNAGGCVIRVERSGGDRIVLSDHASEKALDDFNEFDGFILNTRTLSAYLRDVSAVVSAILKPKEVVHEAD